MKAMRGLRILVSILLVMTAMVATTDDARAQGFQGAIRGLVKDAGGVVPGADVTLVREETSVSRSTTTNEAGEYTFPNLLPGTYTLKLALQGYKGYAQAGIQVGTQQFITIDVALEVGAVAETVTVNGQSPLIETSTASTGTVLDTHTLQTLPSPGRAAFLIGTSVPTVIPSGDTQFNRQQDQTNASLLSLGGGTRRGNNYTLDGVPITDLRNRASANPTIESLEDLKVQVHTYDAGMGRTGGGVFNTTLRSGSNALRGTAFGQTRPLWGQTNNYFSEKAGLAKPNSPYYLGGGGVGGPIVKNRTFFWFASESYHDVQTRNASPAKHAIERRNCACCQPLSIRPPSVARGTFVWSALRGEPKMWEHRWLSAPSGATPDASARGPRPRARALATSLLDKLRRRHSCRVWARISRFDSVRSRWLVPSPAAATADRLRAIGGVTSLQTSSRSSCTPRSRDLPVKWMS